MRGWRFPRHIRALQAAVMRLLFDPECNRLVVEMPVRFGKSLYSTWALPAWYLMSFPHRSVILATYAANFSEEWSDKVMSTVKDHGEHFTGVGLGRIKTRGYWTVSEPWRGSMRTASPSAGIAGKGANLIIADDLVKDMREVISARRRDSLDTWCNAELLTRLEPGGKFLAIMSRRHPDDQSGRWLAMNDELPPRDRWHRITFPAIDETGESLWPQRWPVQKLLDIKRGLELAGESYLWDSLYQQNPRADSTLIEWPEHYTSDAIFYHDLPLKPEEIKWRILSLDPSKGRDSKTGDYSAWSDVTLDRQAVLWTFPTLLRVPAEQVEDETVAMLSRARYDALAVECNGFQEVIADNILRKCREKKIACPLFRHYNQENKQVRIRLGIGPLLDQKRIRICSRSPQARLALNQLKEFPTAAHDDFPDSLNQAADQINNMLRKQ